MDTPHISSHVFEAERVSSGWEVASKKVTDSQEQNCRQYSAKYVTELVRICIIGYQLKALDILH